MSSMINIQKFHYVWAPTHGPHSFSQSRGTWKEDAVVPGDHLEVGTADGEAEIVSVTFNSKDADLRVSGREMTLDAWEEFVHFVESCDRKVSEHCPEEGDVNPVDEDQAG